jgi:hypothetical protein
MDFRCLRGERRGLNGAGVTAAGRDGPVVIPRVNRLSMGSGKRLMSGVVPGIFGAALPSNHWTFS